MGIQLTATESILLQEADIAIAYDNTRFAVSNVQPGTLNSGFSLTVGFPASGEVTAKAVSSTPPNLTPGTVGTIETFTLTALANAPLGGSTGDLNLQASFGNTITAVYGDAFGDPIALTPSPSNGFDSIIDGTATVVPEPSFSLVLMLGGISILQRKARHPVTV